tara:strand:- start:2191 stop:3831 length:1641 start_codon:yes stop_codon:yes gene_type:complete
MKHIYIFIFFLFSTLIFSQNPDEIQLQTNGYGANENEAIMDALKMAVENAYGVFINTSTTIINDQLIEDEIKSLGKGNIIDYTIISQSKINNTYSVNLKSTVSLSKMMEFGKNSGQEVNLNGGLFARNLKLQELYEKNELSIIKNFIRELNQLYKTVFDYSISFTDPVLVSGKVKSRSGFVTDIGSSEKYKIDIQVNTHINNNSKNIEKILHDLKFISMDLEDAISYKKINKPVYPIIISINEDEDLYFILRSKLSRDYFLTNYSDIIRFYMKNFVFSDGLKTDFSKLGAAATSYDLSLFSSWLNRLGIPTNMLQHADIKKFNGTPPLILESLDYEYLTYKLYQRAIKKGYKNSDISLLIGFHSNFFTNKFRNDKASPFLVNSKIAGSWYKRPPYTSTGWSWGGADRANKFISGQSSRGTQGATLMNNYQSEYNTVVGDFTGKLRKISKSYGKSDKKKMKQFLKLYIGSKTFGIQSDWHFPWILNSLDFLIKNNLTFQGNEKFGKIFSYFNFQIFYSAEELSQLKIFSVKPSNSLFNPRKFKFKVD